LLGSADSPRRTHSCWLPSLPCSGHSRAAGWSGTCCCCWGSREPRWLLARFAPWAGLGWRDWVSRGRVRNLAPQALGMPSCSSGSLISLSAHLGSTSEASAAQLCRGSVQPVAPWSP